MINEQPQLWRRARVNWVYINKGEISNFIYFIHVFFLWIIYCQQSYYFI